MIRQLQEGNRQGSMLSGRAADSLTSDERIQWRFIRKELERNGLTLSVLDNNRELVIECLTTALASADIHLVNRKGKERVDQSPPPPPPLSSDTTMNFLMDSAFKISTESRNAADEQILNHVGEEMAEPVCLTSKILAQFPRSHAWIDIFKYTR